MEVYNSILEIDSLLLDEDTKHLLNLLERVNPTEQKYFYNGKTLVITYKLILDLFNFSKKISFKVPVRIVGFPISIEKQGVIGDSTGLFEALKKIKGISVVLNMDESIENGGNTLSSFVFLNKFNSFDEYLNNLRSGYRRRINEALSKGEKLKVNKIEKTKFTNDHYRLYKEVYYRSKNKLELLPIEFFNSFEGEIYEFNDLGGNILSFILLKQTSKKMSFMFCGFKKEDIENYDIYYNMLLLTIKEGIQKGVSEINFGQTSEETKLKIGCIEIKKFLYIHHNNMVLRFIFNILTPKFSYKGYKVNHKVFKENI